MSVDVSTQAVQHQSREGLPPFEILYDRYHTRVYRYLYARLRDENDAADLLQQVFLLAWKQGHGYEPSRGSVATWLLSIAHHRLVDFYRVTRPSVPWETVSDSAAPDETPEAQIISEDSLTLVKKLLDGLSLPEQELLALRFAGGLASAEIAAIVGKSEAATKKRITRLLQRLREQYRRQELETPLPDALEPTLPAFIAAVLQVYAVSIPDLQAVRQRLLAQVGLGLS